MHSSTLLQVPVAAHPRCRNACAGSVLNFRIWFQFLKNKSCRIDVCLATVDMPPRRSQTVLHPTPPNKHSHKSDLFFRKVDLKGVRRLDVKALEGFPGLNSLHICFVLDECDIRSCRNQSDFLESRKLQQAILVGSVIGFTGGGTCVDKGHKHRHTLVWLVHRHGLTALVKLVGLGWVPSKAVPD